MNKLVVVDHRGFFTYIDINHLGSFHDMAISHHFNNQ
jgi:hypothetical protein